MYRYSTIVRSFAIASVAAAALSFAGCSEDEPTTPSSKAGTFIGDTQNLDTNTMTSWVKLDDNGNPLSVGVTFEESLLAALPTTGMGPSFHLALPSQASMMPYDHITLDWNAEGHEPDPIYTHPHFDLHFYTIDTNARKQIIGGPDLTPVEAQYIPEDHGTGGPAMAVPEMGVHYVDLTSGEFHGHGFTHTFIYGFYAGNLVFQEPMFTKAFLETKQDVTANIKQPAAFQRTGLYYPTKYSIKYDAAKREYTFALEGMVKK